MVPALQSLTDIIAQSRNLLDIVPNEDNGQYACSEQTWKRATEFLSKNAQWVWEDIGKVIDAPEILPGPDNSIDLHWEYSDYEFLINIPADPTAMAGFYGDAHDGELSIKGKSDPSRVNHRLFPWMMNYPR